MIQPPPINQSMTSREWGLILLLSVLWGGSFYFVAVALRGFPPVTLIVLRIAIAMLLLLCLLRAMGQKLPRDPRLWRDFLIMGAFMFFASRRQRKAVQATIDLQESLRVGDRVQTTSGLQATVVAIGEDTVS